MKRVYTTILLSLAFGLAFTQEQNSKAKVEYHNALSKYKDQTDKQIKQRLNLTQNLSELNNDIKSLQEAKEKLRKQFESNQQTKNNIRNNLSKYQNEIQNLNTKIQSAITDHNYNWPNTPLGAAKLITNIKFTSLKDFFSILTEETLRASTFNKCATDVIGPNNLVKNENILLVGNLGAYSLDGKPSLLLLKKDSFSKADSVNLNESDLKKLQQPFVSGTPFDVTGGAALALQQEEPDLWQKMENGGIIIYPILLTGLVACFIVLTKSFSLIGDAGKTISLENQILETAKSGQWQNLSATLKNKKSMIHKIIYETLSKNLNTKQEKEAYIEERIYEKIPHLEKTLPTLNILGVISPLLGLLGTVSGMIATFDIIALHGAGDPGLLSKGISEALITTQLGLMVAVPIVLVHSLLSSKVEGIINDMQLIANTLISSMHPNEQQESTDDQ